MRFKQNWNDRRSSVLSILEAHSQYLIEYREYIYHPVEIQSMYTHDGDYRESLYTSSGE